MYLRVCINVYPYTYTLCVCDHKVGMMLTALPEHRSKCTKQNSTWTTVFIFLRLSIHTRKGIVNERYLWHRSDLLLMTPYSWHRSDLPLREKGANRRDHVNTHSPLLFFFYVDMFLFFFVGKFLFFFTYIYIVFAFLFPPLFIPLVIIHLTKIWRYLSFFIIIFRNYIFPESHSRFNNFLHQKLFSYIYIFSFFFQYHD